MLVVSISLIGCGQDADDGLDGGGKTRDRAPIFLSTAPADAQVDVPYLYNVTVVDADNKDVDITIFVNAFDTCGGLAAASKFGIGTFQYTFAPDVSQVNTQCVVGLTASDGKKQTYQNTKVNINDNDNDESALPYFTSTAPANGTEEVLYTYDITVADDDLPAQTLTITLNAYDLCGGLLVDNGDGTGTYTFTPDENMGGFPCLISLTVTDSTGAAIAQNSLIDIAEDNKTPYFTSTAPSTATEDVLYVYNIVADDDDTPAQDLTLSAGAGDTCGGAITDLGSGVGMYSFTPDENAGGTQCAAEITVTDVGGESETQTSNVSINEDNQAPYFTSTAPANALENALYTYNITAGDDDIPAQTLTLTVNGATDTCGGALVDNGNGTGAYTFTPNENQGGATCQIGLTVTDAGASSATQSSTVNINEDNIAPSFTSSASTAAAEATLYSYNITVTDSDVPAQSLIIAKNASDTCGGNLVDNGDGTGVYTFTPTEAQGGSTCVVGLRVIDSGGANANQNTTVNIAESNQAPYFISTAPANALENDLYTYNIAVNDDDIPAQTLMLTVNVATDTCGGSVAGNAYTFTPDETGGGTTCTVGLRVTDNGAPNLFADQDTNVTIDEENQNPTWTTQPSNIVTHINQTYNAANGAATDADTPNAALGDPGYLACVNAASSCSFGITVTGAGAGTSACNVTFTAGASSETCSLLLEAQDGLGGAAQQIVIIFVNDIWYVDSNAVDDRSGTSWADPFNNLDKALWTAQEGDMVWVREGSYTNATPEVTPVLEMKEGVDIYGGFVGTENSLDDRIDPLNLANRSVLDGEGTSSIVVLGASYAVLDGFEITGGYSPTNSYYSGGGILNNFVYDSIFNNLYLYGNYSMNGGGMANGNFSNPTISNSVFCYNFAYDGGGMLNFYYSTPTISNNYFFGNIGVAGGGMANINYAKPTVSDCVFYFNLGIYAGGGMLNYYADSAVYDSIFEKNISPNKGGAMLNAYSYATLDGDVFYYNATLNDGGAILNYYSDVSISDSTFERNIASDKGGGVLNYKSYAVISDSIFSYNEAGTGGGLINAYYPCYIYDSVFVDNYADLAAGIVNYNSNSVIDGNTIYSNYAKYDGAGLTNVYSDATIRNNIIDSNATGDDGFAGGIGNASSNPIIHNNIITDNYSYYGGGMLNVNSNPQITNTTFAYNTAHFGGGMFNVSSTPVISNSIMWNDNSIAPSYFSGPLTYTIYQDEIGGADATVTYSDVKFIYAYAYNDFRNTKHPGSGNIYNDPLFVGDFYLNQLLSPCVNTGDIFSPFFGTTSTVGTPDSGRIDMGFHHPIP